MDMPTLWKSIVMAVLAAVFVLLIVVSPRIMRAGRPSGAAPRGNASLEAVPAPGPEQTPS